MAMGKVNKKGVDMKPKKKHKIMIYTDHELDWQHLKIINKTLEPGALDGIPDEDHCIITLGEHQGIVHKNKKSLGIYLSGPRVEVRKKGGGGSGGSDAG